MIPGSHVSGFVRGGTVFLLLAMIMLSACATRHVIDTAPPPLLTSVPDIAIVDVDVLAVTPEMKRFLERYILPYRNLETRLNLLTLAITSNGVLGFNYDEALTLTAAEAFSSRSGNCIGFANMMVALAREAGLQAKYQEMYRRPEWTSREDTLLLIKHINVVVSSPQHSYVVDVSGVKFRSNVRRRLIPDPYAKALYYNNIGAEALLGGELPLAWAYLSTAINTSPELPDPWINLGVVFGRNEQLKEAEQVYLTALQINPSEYSAMNNLYEVYLEQQNLVAAEELWGKVEKYREKNPYYLMKLSEESLQRGDYEQSIQLLQRAIKKQGTDHMLYFAMAKTQYLSGQQSAAQDSLHRARELAPKTLLAYYNRPLNELVTESMLVAE